MLYALISIGAAVCALLAVILGRALCFRPPKTAPRVPSAVSFDEQKAVRDLSRMIQCKTVSSTDPARENAAEFERFHALLPTLFPAVFATCERIDLPERGILLRWRGRRAEAPLVLMSHYDVVSVEEAQWSHPPFSGLVENGVLWGRGTLDTKGTLNGILQAAEALIASGFSPERDVYFAFSGNEEIGGNGAVAAVDWFEQNGIVPGAVIDEGGAVVEHVFPGVDRPVAMVGIAEKGMLNLRFTVHSNGGHASAPPAHTPVGQLSAACVRLESKPFPFRLTKPAAQMFDTLGRHSSFLYRVIFANLWLFRPLLDRLCRKKGGELGALVRTTVAFTQMRGSEGENVIPPKATMLANLRLMGGDTMESAAAYVKKVIRDDQITLTPVFGMNPSRVSRTDCAAWQTLTRAIEDTWQGVIVSPYLMLACSDSRHYGRISDRVYRFSAMALSAEERATIHGNDERVPLSTVTKTVEFYLRILQNA